MLTRRNLLASGLGLGLSACMSDNPLKDMTEPLELASDSLPSLKELGRQRGLEIGSAFSGTQDRGYRQLLKRHCAVITPEWQLKPKFLKPTQRAAYNFGPGDNIARFASRNGIRLHGHTLFWHEEPIDWAQSNDFDQVKLHYGGFLRDVTRHYSRATSWDVLSELVEERERFRNQYLIRNHGIQFIDFCLRTVNDSAPHAKLAINEFNLTCGEGWCRSKQDNMLTLLRQLKRMKTPVHALGIQSHLSSIYKTSTRSTLDFIDRVADLGLDVFISELDVNDSTMPADIATRDQQVADYYEQFLTAALSRQAVKRVVFWGISDSDNWIVRGYTEEKRKKGTPRPALFDSANQPKPAFHAVVRALKSAPVRSA